MFVCLLSLSILPLLTFAIFGCGKNRETAHKNSDKSSKSKSGKSAKSNKTQKSNKSKKSKKSQKSKKSGKSTKSKSKKGKKASASAKSKKAVKSGKSAKSAKSAKSVKTATSISAKSSKGSCKSQPKVNPAVNLIACPIASKPAPIESKPLELRTEPKEMTYKKSGGIQSFNVINNTNEARVFKVKCSDNQLYRVHPVYLIVEGGQTGKIEILRQNGAPKTDKLVLVSVKADAAFGDAKTMFSQGSAQPQHMLAVPLIVDA